MAIFDSLKKSKKADPNLVTEATKPVEKKSEPTNVQGVSSFAAYSVIVKPIVTEKVAALGAANKYGFVVVPSASKSAIKNAVESLYKVTVKGVNVINMQGRVVRFGRSAGKRSDYKKAIVTLAPGQTIAVHEGV